MSKKEQLEPATLRFLQQLKKNNNREWFEKNRKAYEAARQDVQEIVDAVIQSFSKKDPAIGHLTAKDCLFRIYRDVRFSKNKEPYKPNMGASINPGGRKSMLAGYYLHIEPGNCFAGGGCYMAEPDALKRIRQEIDYNWEEFQQILYAKPFVKVYGELSRNKEFTLTREPKGYEKDNPAIDYLKLKSWVALTQIPDTDLTSKGFVRKITAAFEALQPLVVFLNRAIEG
ncbi:MAG TPA: DUF2461 domain-containing protein [Sediminibacterium sp.]|nr:DUF2461 domain-containing protein [Sediminibacterium sp.]